MLLRCGFSPIAIFIFSFWSNALSLSATVLNEWEYSLRNQTVESTNLIFCTVFCLWSAVFSKDPMFASITFRFSFIYLIINLMKFSLFLYT